jgi:hypothetical protein
MTYNHCEAFMETGYYRLIDKFPDWDDEVGTLWYVSEIKGDRVSIIQGGGEYEIDLDDLVNRFEFAPDGISERQQEIVELMSDLHTVGVREDRLLASAQTQKLLGDDKPVVPSESTALSIGGTNAVAAAHNLKKIKTTFAQVKSSITKRQTALANLIKEQSLILQAKASALSKQIAHAEDAIYMINAYLGKDEEIVRLQKGKPAPEELKISIRQLVLYMDEETAAAANLAEKGGMDFKDIHAFDEWLKVPANLKLVLPEEKGIVAFKPRRHEKHYGDNPWENAELNRKNKCLYILIRNGENLYRIYTNLWLDDVFLPRKDEFEHFFYETKWDKKEVRHRPGSKEYMESMEKAQAHQRKFYTVLILIQGILDRTKIFHPLPVDQTINVCNLAEAQKYITLVYDAENLFGSSRPDFDDWLDEANSKLTVGCRIMGRFQGYGDDHTMYYEEMKRRLNPRYAVNPQNETLYTLERRSGEGFLFLFSRNGQILYSGWGDYHGHEAKRRASFKVYKKDDFILNFDAVTIEEMQFYIHSRTNRHHYLSMIPLLKLAIKLKKKEIQEERDFRKLLIGQIVKAHNVSFENAESQIDTLIVWWKFKCRIHRALTSDDAKAIRMIVAEFGKRKSLEDTHAALVQSHEKAVMQLCTDNALAIFIKNDKEYVVYRWHNDENIFVCEQIWNRWGMEEPNRPCSCLLQKSWQTVDKRHESWKLLWKHERWDSWAIGARPQEHLTDPERAEGIQYLLRLLRQDKKKLAHRHKDRKPWMLPLAVVLDKEENVRLYYAACHAYINREALLTDKVQDVEYGRLKLGWQKKEGKITFTLATENLITMDLQSPPWKVATKWEEVLTPIELYEDNIQAALNEIVEVEEAEKLQDELEQPLRGIMHRVRDALKAVWYEEEHKKFLEDYIDDEDGSLWADFKEELHVPNDVLWPYWIEYIAAPLVERGIDINGWTLEKVLLTSKVQLREDHVTQYESVKDFVIEYSKEEAG